MPRFGTKTLLFAFILVALWFSTFSGYAAGHDVRASVLLVVFLAAGFAAIYGRGRLRAFWAGFFVVMLLCGGNFWQGPANKYVPNFSWRSPVIVPMPYGAYFSAPAVYQPSPYVSDPAIAVPQPYRLAIAAPRPAPNIGDQHVALAAHASIEAACILALACIVGLVGTWLYSSIGRKNEQS
jgi:hypothetical protein